eukprot:COSAG06_NODE_68921_length_199_cov_841.490000_1_plen_34_part_01
MRWWWASGECECLRPVKGEIEIETERQRDERVLL